MEGWYEDPDRVLAAAERTGHTAWVFLRIGLCWLELLGAPLYWSWFGKRFPTLNNWQVDAWGTGMFYITAALWGAAMTQALLPWSLSGTVTPSPGQVRGLTVRGWRTVRLESGTVLHQWRVPTPEGAPITWWSVRCGRDWLLVLHHRQISIASWVDLGCEVKDYSRRGPVMRGWGVALLGFALTLLGGLLALGLANPK